jgi:hypothetical protein
VFGRLLPRQAGGYVPEEIEVTTPSDPTPRAFARGVGFVMQAVGATGFILSTCACCGISAFADHTVAPLDRGYFILLFATVVGSLALVGFGLGLQADRGRLPAIGTALTAVVLTFAYVGAGISLWMTAAPAVMVLLAAVMALIGVGLSLLAWPAMIQVLVDPPKRAGPPTVSGDAYRDPWAEERPRDDSPTRQHLARRREKIMRELREIEDAERNLDE